MVKVFKNCKSPRSKYLNVASLLVKNFLVMSLLVTAPFSEARSLFKKAAPPAPKPTPAPEDFQSEFSRTQWILRHLNIPAEPSYQQQLSLLNNQQTQEGVQKMLRYLDPKGGFALFSEVDASALHVYQDRVSKQVEDFTVPLGNAQKLIPLFTHLKSTADKPLQGLRIALDPGHMGGDFWDEATGRAVYEKKGKKGRKLSEGMLTLETCLLMKEQFEKWGATVFVTHETVGPVTPLQLKDIKPSDYAPEEILQATLMPWFLKLVQTYAEGAALGNAVDQNPEIKKLNSESMRNDDFISHADLDARVQLITNFHPDITLIIHYNTSDPVDDSWGLSKGYDRVGAYVTGGFASDEFGSRQWRAEFAGRLLNPTAWQSSVDLSREIVNQMRENLSLLPDRSDYGGAVEIEPGIMARNLSLTRQLSNLTLSYVEGLYYNDPAEFELIAQNDHVMQIGGVAVSYSDRIAKVAATIAQSVVSYVHKYTSSAISN